MSLPVWGIRLEAAPRVLRPCPRCHTARPFASTGRSRVNANGRRLDVWLIYACSTCERTWNRTVHERVSPESLGSDLSRYEANDPDLALAVAARVAGLSIEPPPWSWSGDRTAVEIVLQVRPGVHVRLDALLSRALEISRSSVAKRGREEPGPRALRRTVVDGQRVSLASFSDRWR